MVNFNPQQPPGMFPAIDELETRVHGVVPYVLGACGAVGGYFWGIAQSTLPVALCVGLGLVVGLLLVPIILKLATLTLCVAIVGAAAVLTFWLLGNDAAMKQRPASTAMPAPVIKPQSAFDRLFPGVRP